MDAVLERPCPQAVAAHPAGGGAAPEQLGCINGALRLAGPWW